MRVDYGQLALSSQVLRRQSDDSVPATVDYAKTRPRAAKPGPLSLRATVVIERSASADGEDRVIFSMIARDALAPEVAGVGWMRAADVPVESAANPRTARTLGIR